MAQIQAYTGKVRDSLTGKEAQVYLEDVSFKNAKAVVNTSIIEVSATDMKLVRIYECPNRKTCFTCSKATLGTANTSISISCSAYAANTAANKAALNRAAINGFCPQYAVL
jgi:hypothetical protein